MTEESLTFQVGKYYKHSGGKAIYICGSVFSEIYGPALIAEEREGKYYPVGSDTTSATNYSEISRDQYMNDVVCKDCGKDARELLDGAYLKRTNPKGEAGIWKCHPGCGEDREGSALLNALGDNNPSSEERI